MLWYVFEMFSQNFFTQLKLLSPLLVVGLGAFLLGSLGLRNRVKVSRRVLGHFILATLGAYAIFIIMMLLLPVTGTSYGAPQPVIVVFGSLYLFMLGIGLVGAALLFGWSWFRQRWRKVVAAYYITQLAILGLLFYAFYIEPLWVDVTYTTVQESKLPSGTAPIKIALISDIHMERWTRREDEVLARMAALDPDLIVISGDHINVDYTHDEEAYADLHRFFQGLKARYGVYAVGGVVDSQEETKKVVAGTEVRLLDDEVTTVTVHGQPLTLVGLQSYYAYDGAELVNLTQNLPDDALKILLYHTPDLHQAAVDNRIDLYLAGHTHGGQIALPFFGAIFTASQSRRYAAGLYDLGGPAQTRLYVTRGIGMEGMNTPRARLFARPEISVITLVPGR